MSDCGSGPESGAFRVQAGGGAGLTEERIIRRYESCAGPLRGWWGVALRERLWPGTLHSEGRLSQTC